MNELVSTIYNINCTEIELNKNFKFYLFLKIRVCIL